ncbi:MAG: hypothetical protein R3C44_11360 [Chloroflexota bacterium]
MTTYHYSNQPTYPLMRSGPDLIPKTRTRRRTLPELLERFEPTSLEQMADVTCWIASRRST